MESLFTRTYRYRQRESRNELENFCTEILAYCIENDDVFRNDFFEILEIEFADHQRIATQQHYEDAGRPDIEIVGDGYHIIIECKIDSGERENQLSNYINIFETKRNRKRYLVYLTKFYEHKVIQHKDVSFINLTWAEINRIAEKSENIVILEFSKFLKEKNISMEKNFKNIDLISLENISNAISKMDEVLDSVKEYFSKSFGNPSKDSSRSTQLKWNAYYNYKHIGNPLKYTLDIGFQWWFDNGLVYLTLRIYIPSSAYLAKETTSFFKKHLSHLDWELEEDEEVNIIAKYLNVNEVTATEDEQIPEMIKFLTSAITELNDLKKLKPEYFQ